MHSKNVLRPWFIEGARAAWRARAVALAAALLLLGGLARADWHFWTDQDGRRYEAELLRVANDQVTLQRPDGRTLTLALDDLAPADQLLAQDWLDQQTTQLAAAPPPVGNLSTYGRSFVLDEPRVVRLRALPNKGYLDAYLALPLTLRNDQAGPLDFVHFYFYDADHKMRVFPQPPDGNPLMIQDGHTTALKAPRDFKPGQPYTVLFPLQDPTVRIAPFAVIVAGNTDQVVAAVYPEGTWRDFTFPERFMVAQDKYADYSAQELYPGQDPASLFELTDVARLVPANGDHAPDRDYFRLSLRLRQPFPAAALSGQWYAFDRDHHLLHAEEFPPYSQPGRKDTFYYLLLAGHGPADLGDAVPPTTGESWDTLQLPGGAWWDKPEVDSLVFVFGTETKKVARVFTKSAATFASLPVPEKAAFGQAAPAPQSTLPTRNY